MMTTLMTLRKMTLENIVGNEENAGNQHIHLFPQCFLLYNMTNFMFCLHLWSANAFNSDRAKILSAC